MDGAWARGGNYRCASNASAGCVGHFLCFVLAVHFILLVEDLRTFSGIGDIVFR